MSAARRVQCRCNQCSTRARLQRNRALANARTEAVLLLDVDFWPSAELSELMQKPAKYESLVNTLQGGAAVVLPAFETGDPGDIGVEVAREAVLGESADKHAVKQCC